MRRTTPGTLLEQARIFALHLNSSPEGTLDHHAGEIARFLLFLHTRTAVTHSVRRDIPGPVFPPPEAFLGPDAPASTAAARVARSKTVIAHLFRDLLDRRLRLAVLPEETAAP